MTVGILAQVTAVRWLKADLAHQLAQHSIRYFIHSPTFGLLWLLALALQSGALEEIIRGVRKNRYVIHDAEDVATWIAAPWSSERRNVIHWLHQLRYS